MDQYIGEIRMFAGNYSPVWWAFCSGTVLTINQNSVLFALIGATYGGNGTTSFALPDMRGRLPVHQGSSGSLTPRVMGQAYGSESVTLTQPQMPQHTHGFQASTQSASTPFPQNAVLASVPSPDTLYLDSATTPTDPKMLNMQSVQAMGGGLPHENMMPFLGISFIMALQGIFPSRN